MNKSRKDKRRRLREIEELRKREWHREYLSHKENREKCMPSYSGCGKCEWRNDPDCKAKLQERRMFILEGLAKLMEERANQEEDDE